MTGIVADRVQRVGAVELRDAVTAEIQAEDLALKLRDDEGIRVRWARSGLSRASPQRPHAL